MSTIDISFVEQFRGNVIHLAQQQGSKLRRYVRDDPDFLQGKAGYFERVGQTAMAKRTTRHGDTPLMDVPHSRRRVTMDDYEWADLIDHQDRIRQLIDPASAYTRSAMMAMGRQWDDLIIAALTGNAYAMDADDAATATALPTAQKINVNDHTYDSGSGDVALTVSKLQKARQIFRAAEVDLDMEKPIIICSEHQIQELLTDTKIGSTDYNSVRALVTGELNTYMGFSFVQTERTLTDSSDDELVVAFLPSAIGLAVGEEMFFRTSERDDKSYAQQIYLAFSAGATRVEDEKVVQIACDPT